MTTQNDVWSGPALANPRNQRVRTWMTNLSEQWIDVRLAFENGRLPSQNDVEIFVQTDSKVDGAGATFHGRIESSDFTWLPIERKLCFHMWAGDSDFGPGYRKVYEFDIDLNKTNKEITIHEIAVAPDRPVSASDPATPS